MFLLNDLVLALRQTGMTRLGPGCFLSIGYILVGFVIPLKVVCLDDRFSFHPRLHAYDLKTAEHIDG